MSEHFRRTDPRYDRQLEVELTAGGAQGARLIAVSRNVSLGGMYLEAAESVPVGTTLQVRFKVPTQPEPIEVGGEVRWAESGSQAGMVGLGIRFQGLRAREVWALNRFFQS